MNVCLQLTIAQIDIQSPDLFQKSDEGIIIFHLPPRSTKYIFQLSRGRLVSLLTTIDASVKGRINQQLNLGEIRLSIEDKTPPSIDHLLREKSFLEFTEKDIKILNDKNAHIFFEINISPDLAKKTMKWNISRKDWEKALSFFRDALPFVNKLWNFPVETLLCEN